MSDPQNVCRNCQVQKFNENETQEGAKWTEIIASFEHIIRWLEGAWILKKDFSKDMIYAKAPIIHQLTKQRQTFIHCLKKYLVNSYKVLMLQQ